MTLQTSAEGEQRKQYTKENLLEIENSVKNVLLSNEELIPVLKDNLQTGTQGIAQDSGQQRGQGNWSTQSKPHGGHQHGRDIRVDGRGRGGYGRDYPRMPPPPHTNDDQNDWSTRKFTLDPVRNSVLAVDRGSRQKILRGLLNKLTPDNYDKILERMAEGGWDKETQEGFINQIFDKAVSEPTFCEVYAKLCWDLLPFARDPEEKVNEHERPRMFRSTLLNKCQQEFESGKEAFTRKEAEKAGPAVEPASEAAAAAQAPEVSAEAAASATPEAKAAPPTLSARDNLLRRRRFTGLMQFLGHLYKFTLVTSRIIYDCILVLLGTEPVAEDIECACKLLSTVGGVLAIQDKKSKGKYVTGTTEKSKKPAAKNTHTALDAFDHQLKLLRDSGKYEHRIRFLIQDVLDLKARHWEPLTKDEGPKRLADIHKEAEEQRRRTEEQDKKERERERMQQGPRGRYSGGPGYGGPGPVQGRQGRGPQSAVPAERIKALPSSVTSVDLGEASLRPTSRIVNRPAAVGAARPGIEPQGVRAPPPPTASVVAAPLPEPKRWSPEDIRSRGKGLYEAIYGHNDLEAVEALEGLLDAGRLDDLRGLLVEQLKLALETRSITDVSQRYGPLVTFLKHKALPPARPLAEFGLPKEEEEKPAAAAAELIAAPKPAAATPEPVAAAPAALAAAVPKRPYKEDETVSEAVDEIPPKCSPAAPKFSPAAPKFIPRAIAGESKKNEVSPADTKHKSSVEEKKDEVSVEKKDEISVEEKKDEVSVEKKKDEILVEEKVAAEAAPVEEKDGDKVEEEATTTEEKKDRKVLLSPRVLEEACVAFIKEFSRIVEENMKAPSALANLLGELVTDGYTRFQPLFAAVLEKDPRRAAAAEDAADGEEDLAPLVDAGCADALLVGTLRKVSEAAGESVALQLLTRSGLKLGDFVLFPEDVERCFYKQLPFLKKEEAVTSA